jgi:phosphatidylinositol alpha-1,6-mannosyltransferase
VNNVSSSRPKLLILTSTLPRWEGDCEPRFVLDLARALSDRFDPLILAPMAVDSVTGGTLEGIKVERFPYAPVASWQKLAAPGAILPNLRKQPLLYALVPALIIAQFVALVRTLRGEQFDLIHCHWIIPQAIVLKFVSLFVRVPPTLVTCHGADAFTLEFPPFSSLKRRVLNQADAVTVVSREIATHLGHHIHKPLIHISMGVDLERFAMRERLPNATPAVLFVGRLAAKKGLDRLIRAMADPRLIDRAVQLRVVGDGPLREGLENLALTLGVSSRVSFIGPLPHEGVAQEMQRAAIFCAPFVVASDGDREGTPTVLIEAAASGVPIITSDIGGCGDIVVPGQSGWLLPPGDEIALADAMVDALDNGAKTREMAIQARRMVEEYSWTRVAARYADVLESIRGSRTAVAC